MITLSAKNGTRIGLTKTVVTVGNTIGKYYELG